MFKSHFRIPYSEFSFSFHTRVEFQQAEEPVLVTLSSVSAPHSTCYLVILIPYRTWLGLQYKLKKIPP